METLAKHTAKNNTKGMSYRTFLPIDFFGFWPRNDIGRKVSVSMPLVVFTLILIFMTSCNQKTPVDLIVHNANYTVNNDFSKAQAFAVKDGKFVAVGDEESIMCQYAAKETIDAQGDAVYPGFMDGHSHFTGYGENLVRWADLKGCRSYDEVIERLKVHDSLYPAEWLLGRGWDQNLWEVAEFPDMRCWSLKRFLH